MTYLIIWFVLSFPFALAIGWCIRNLMRDNNEAAKLLKLQQERLLYPMDKQIEISRNIRNFLDKRK